MSNSLTNSGMAFHPQTIEETMRFCEMLSKSSMVPKDYQNNPGNVFVSIQWGSELGLQPMQSLQNISVINGRPAIWGDLMLALVQGSGKLEYITEDVSDTAAVCTIKRFGQPEIVRTFSREDAKQAGLLGKQGPWTQYPKRMMQNRARAWALRDGFADVLRGVAIAEEAQDLPAEKDVTPAGAAPKPATRAEQIKQRITAPAPKPEPITIDELIAKLSKVETPEQLTQVDEDSKSLPLESREEYINARRIQLKLLKGKENTTEAEAQDNFVKDMEAAEQS